MYSYHFLSLWLRAGELSCRVHVSSDAVAHVATYEIYSCLVPLPAEARSRSSESSRWQSLGSARASSPDASLPDFMTLSSFRPGRSYLVFP